MRFWLAVLTLVGLDQLTKWAVTVFLTRGESVPLIPGVLWLTHARNPGAAFNLFPGHGAALVMVTLIVIAVAVAFHRRLLDLGLGLPLALILSGGLGNLLDRLRLGQVIDFLDLRFWPVFNLADVYISLGAILIVLATLRGSGRGGAGA
ncbi:MAG: signal peptidase II [Thermoanaerobacterales bacterium]|nr:signal peptidase II [Bacillota bacterium]MDI6906225.1 signal peptidase II [Thermoanaerobacterales bacterium]